VTLEGKVSVVTGASAGIGEATARAFAREGAVVVLSARREERLREIAGELGESASWVRCDVTRLDDLEGLRDTVKARHGRCDVLVNNAGVPGGGPLEQLSLDQIRTVTETNYVSVVVATKLFLPMLIGSKGHVVNVASVAGRFALPGASAYTAAKHAVVAFSEALYYELEPRKVTVTVVNPGLVETEGFPHDKLKRDPRFRPFVMSADRIANTIVDVVRRRKGPEVTVPGWLAPLQAFRVLTPPLYRAAVSRIVANRATEARPPE
jgi:short-subunit dehydrogenase